VIIEFRSKATGSFFMTQAVAQVIFDALGRELTPQGIFTADQVPGVRHELAAVVEKSRQQDRQALDQHDEALREGQSRSEDLPVGLSQRAFPLLEMLTRAEKKGVPVVWGV
jgi:hypothetical protein